MARLRLTADCGSCSFSGYYQISRTLRGQLRSTIIEAGRTLPRRYSNAVSRLDGPRLKATALLFPALAGVVPISYAAASMMALQKPWRESGSAGRAGLNHSFQNLQKTKTLSVRKRFWFPPAVVQGLRRLCGGLFFSWHPGLPHPRI